MGKSDAGIESFCRRLSQIIFKTPDVPDLIFDNFKQPASMYSIHHPMIQGTALADKPVYFISGC